MARFRIVGGTKLRGCVQISGAKNEALKLIPLTILLNNEVKIINLPRISDVLSQLKILKSIGAEFNFKGHILSINCSNVNTAKVPDGVAERLRASIVLVGPLLARFGYADIPLPGGCLIGPRPIDTHTDSFEQLGAEYGVKNNRLKVRLEKPIGNKVKLKEQSVTATENILMYAAGVEHDILIENCAIEPEIIGLIQAINDCGGSIQKISKRSFRVKGSKKMSKAEIEVMPDRIEAGSFAIAFLATGGEGEISLVRENDLEIFFDLLEQINANFEIRNGNLKIHKSDNLKPFKIKTAPFPGFPTDLQSPISLLAARAKGRSFITEAMYENRLSHIIELKKMGLKAEIVDKQNVKIDGPCRLRSTEIESPDLRSGITLLIASLMAEGETIINNVEVIDRGYEKIEEKFKTLGAKIVRE